MKLITAAAIAVLMSSGIAFAQENSGGTSGQQGGAATTGTETGGGTDASNYLNGPNIHRFYTDESMGTLRSEAEVKTTFEAMSAEDQANLRKSCEGNKDNRWSALCNSLPKM